MSHLIGEIFLSISTLLYSIWFIPQVALTFKHKSTKNLSLLMHGFLLLGYSSDLIYAFGRHMQWQYLFVSIIGFIFLLIEHYQFVLFGPKNKTFRLIFTIISLISVTIFLFGIAIILLEHHGKMFYDFFGLVSGTCWVSFAIPQIIKNFKNKSTAGLSFTFVLISIFINIFDVISALTLKWDYPSLIGIPLTLLIKLLLLSQFWFYRKNI